MKDPTLPGPGKTRPKQGLSDKLAAGVLPQRFQEAGFGMNRQGGLTYGGTNKTADYFSQRGLNTPAGSVMLQKLLNAGGQIGRGAAGALPNWNPASLMATRRGMVNVNPESRTFGGAGTLQPWQGEGQQYLGSASADQRSQVSPERLSSLQQQQQGINFGALPQYMRQTSNPVQGAGGMPYNTLPPRPAGGDVVLPEGIAGRRRRTGYPRTVY
jgi:hypothetical protein